MPSSSSVPRIAALSLLVSAVAVACGSDGDEPRAGPDHAGVDGGGSSGAPSDPSADAGAAADAGDALPPASAADPVAGYQSGSRLRARVALGGGRRIVQGFEDTETGPCDIRSTADGQQRCLPYDAGITADVRYLDVTCSQPALLRQETACSRPVHYASVRTTGYTWQGRALTPVPAGTTVYSGTNGNCKATTLPAGTVAYAAEAVEDTRFVAVSRLPVGAGRLRANGWVAEDGARYANGVHDAQQDVDCIPALGPGGTWRCLPDVVDYSFSFGSFADDACSEPLYSTVGSAAPPRFVSYPAGSQQESFCAALPTSVRSVGEAYDGPTHHLAAGSCTPGAASSPASTRSTQAVPAERFAQATFEYAGEGRLQRRVAVSADGTFEIVNNEWLDTELHTTCEIQRDVDGTLTCYPVRTTLFGTAFGDAACTQPLVPSTSICSDDAYVAVADVGAASTSCTPGDARHVFALGAPQPAPATLYRLQDGSCTPYANDAPVRPLQHELPSSAMLHFTEELE